MFCVSTPLHLYDCIKSYRSVSVCEYDTEMTLRHLPQIIFINLYMWCYFFMKKKRTCYFRSDHSAVAVAVTVPDIGVGTGEVRICAQGATAKRMNMNIYLLFNVQPANAVRRQRLWQSCKREDVLSDLKSMASVFLLRYGPLKRCLP